MSVPRQDEPTIAIIAAYTLEILNEIKRGENVLPQEWEYLKSEAVVLLEELLIELDIDFAPSEAAEKQHQMKSLTELNWQTGMVYEALEMIDAIPKGFVRDETPKKMADALSLFKVVVEKTFEKQHYPEERELREGFENCRQFLYHLCGVATGVYTMEMRRLLDAA